MFFPRQPHAITISIILHNAFPLSNLKNFLSNTQLSGPQAVEPLHQLI